MNASSSTWGPSTRLAPRGALRLILEIEAKHRRSPVRNSHTGNEKNPEYRPGPRASPVTRMDYLSPFFNETAYCLGVEKLLISLMRHPSGSTSSAC